MPSFNEFIGRAPLSAATSSPGSTPVVDPEVPTYESLRPYIRPSLFEPLRPHVEEFERRMALRDQAAKSYAAAPSWTTSPVDQAAGLYGVSDTAPEPSSYEDLRPYLRPSLFEALKPHVAGSSYATQSTNWSGQISSGTSYRGVQADWVVPTVQATQYSGISATWIGIDGGPPARYQWGTTDLTLPAGPHTVYIEIPYIFTKIGKATATVNVVAGQTVTLAYRAPLIVFNAGKVTVTP